MGLLLALLVILVTVVQAVICARMAWRAEFKLGAVGLALLAVGSGVVPLWVYCRLR